jgi:hypothetical protein
LRSPSPTTPKIQCGISEDRNSKLAYPSSRGSQAILPAGPKGSKNKYAEQFWADLQAEWEIGGRAVRGRVLHMFSCGLCPYLSSWSRNNPAARRADGYCGDTAIHPKDTAKARSPGAAGAPLKAP